MADRLGSGRPAGPLTECGAARLRLSRRPGPGPPERATAFSLLTPFYFLKAGSLVSLPAIAAGAGTIGLFLAVKLGAKVAGIWPTARAFGLLTRDANYTTLLMSTGLTFGTIAALYGSRMVTSTRLHTRFWSRS